MAVPLLDLKIQNEKSEQELKDAFERVLTSGRYILGPEVESFESSIASYSGAEYGIGVSSGTDAILLALMALGVGPGDEVICPSFTFFATAGCIARTGATPVFTDCSEHTFNMDAGHILPKLNEKTKAVIPVHLFGQMADMDDIVELSKSHGFKIIEDSAQSLGSEYRFRKAGSIGDFGTFSFFPSKNLGGFGDAGMLITSDKDLADRAKIFRMHGSSPKYYHKYVGGNFRLDPLQAALLSVKFKDYDSFIQGRQGNAEYYIDRLSTIEGVSKDSSASGVRIILPSAAEYSGHIWNQFTIRIKNVSKDDTLSRDQLKQFLHDKGIGAEIYYPLPMHRQECFNDLGCNDSDFPVSNLLADECLSIPVYPELTGDQKDEVIDAIQQWLKK